MPFIKHLKTVITIETVLSNRNNFDALRFLAALGVVLSHAYPVTYGSNAHEFLSVLSGGQTTLGEISVMIFFVISGFLITQSFERSISIIDYIVNRILRIVPGLVVVVMFTGLLLGPMVTTNSTEDYLSNPITYRYLGNALIYNVVQRLPGVFEHNSYPMAVNGSLWTLSYEFTCYTSVATIGLALRKAWLSAVLMLIFTLASIFITWISPKLFVMLAGYFLAGSLFYLLRKHIPLDSRLFFVSLSILGLTLFFKHGFNSTIYLFGTYSIIYLAYLPALHMQDFSRYGDFSYGVYIYAFPIQQVFATYATSPQSNFLASTPLILLCAIFSWYMIEKPALSRKRQTANLIKQLLKIQIAGIKDSDRNKERQKKS